jgi:uncharacterized coiled-coil protein SlyX
MLEFKNISEDELLEYVASTEERINSLEGQLAHTQRLLAKLAKQVEDMVHADAEKHRYA